MAGARLTIEPLTPTIGAIIHGIDLRAPLDAETVGQVRRALLDHLVIFFRDQDISVQDHLRFGSYFGELDPPPFQSRETDYPEMLVLDQVSPKGQGADSWHADITYRPEPPMASILRAVQLPSLGGDTCFASMYAAYDALSSSMQRFIDGLTAVNTLAMMAERAKRTDNVMLSEADATASTVHPVVRIHPETGRKLLNVNRNWTSRIVELDDDEGDALLRTLFNHLNSPDFQCRFRWEPHSMAFWDNRVVQHFAVADYHERRVMNRITIAGDRPFGPDDPRAAAFAATDGAATQLTPS